MKRFMSFYRPGKGLLSYCSMVRIRVICLLIIACLITGCDKIKSPQEAEPKQKAIITIVSGNNQTGQGGELLSEPIIVKVTNSAGIPLGNVTVFFGIVEGSGSVANEPTRITSGEGLAEARWEITSGYNGIEVSLRDENYEAVSRYFYAAGENPAGIFKTRTISSLKKITDTLYEITFYGDYSEILRTKNRDYRGSYDYDQAAAQTTNTKKNYCSLFSVFGDPDNYLFGRSFDNPSGWRCLTVASRLNPPGGYASLAPVRMRDFGFSPGIDFDTIPFTQKERLLEAAFFPPDGINEHGLVVGLANVRSLQFEPDPDKKSIFITLLVREILDHAKNVAEAAEIARSYNVFCENTSSLNVHALVADASGHSAILELFDNEIRVIPKKEPWQVITNSPTYNIPIPERRDECWRYRRIYDLLEAKAGVITWQEGMDLLQSVGNTYTEWTAIYDMTRNKMILAIDFNFNRFFHFTFK